MSLPEQIGQAARAIPAVRWFAAALTISIAGVAAVSTYEGTEPQVYLDVVGIPTVCTGHTAGVTKADVGKKLAPEVCDQLLRQDLREAEQVIKSTVKVPVTQAQYDALVSLEFNIGGGNFRRSTLLRKLNAGDCWGAGREFSRWANAGGRPVDGLARRRAGERSLFETGCTK